MKNNPSAVFKPWPALADSAHILPLGKKNTLFYYDSEKSEDPKGSGSPPGKPAIILVHGLGDEADSWRHLVPQLKQAGCRTLALDLPGFGRSAAQGRINMKRHAEAVCRLMETAGPAILAGSSMGGMVVQEAAAKRPDLARGLVLLDGGRPLAVKVPGITLIGAFPILGTRWYRALRKDHKAAYRSLFGYYGDFEKLPQADKDFLRERVIARVESRAQERAYFGSLRSLIWINMTGKGAFSRSFKAFPGKILILWGEDDPILPPAAAAALRSLRPDAAFQIIPGAGHLPQQERPTETTEAILRFAATFSA